jgi:hypothetical protein
MRDNLSLNDRTNTLTVVHEPGRAFQLPARALRVGELVCRVLQDLFNCVG